MILGEIGDICRFSDPKQLLAFVGLDSSVYQSGNFQAKRTRMSKRGSKVLLHALMNAAHNVVKNNSTFKAYYDAKMEEDQTHYNASRIRPTNSSGSYSRCSLTMSRLISFKGNRNSVEKLPQFMLDFSRPFSSL